MDKVAMSIDEQVAYLMQGTEYGDDELKQAMADENLKVETRDENGKWAEYKE